MHMSVQRIFSLEEANALLPKIRMMLVKANEELAARGKTLTHAHAVYEKCEQEMNLIKPLSDGFLDLRQCRLNFQLAIESLTEAKQNYLQAINFWFEEITDTGVILRDIKSGLLDFPARCNSFEYYLCWQLADDAINHWHMIDNGFKGRRPLAILNEYI